MGYLQKTGQTRGQHRLYGKSRANGVNLNTDLENLSGFGLVNSIASKSNCFSHRAD